MLAFSPAQAQRDTVELRLIETTDVHGSFFPYDFMNRREKGGSMARICTYVKNQRQKYGDNLLLLDNGDILQGQPTNYFYNYVNTDDTNIAADIVNYMHYDAQTVGNHDVEPGHDVYDKWISEVSCPVLGANVVDASTGAPYLKPYAVFQRSGLKIAVLGMLTPAIPNWLAPDIWSGLRFDNMVESARYWVDRIQKEEQPDVLIGLLHSGRNGGISTPTYEENATEQVARQVPGFDLIFYGHDHRRQNFMTENIEGNHVLCLNPANNAMNVAAATIEVIRENGEIVEKNIEGKIVSMNGQDVDADFMAHFKPHIKKIESFVNRKIGTLSKTIYSRDGFFGDSEMNDLILNMELKITNADIAINAPLSFNAVLNKGDIMMSDMFKLYRYENRLYVMDLTGEELKGHLEMSYALWTNQMKSKDDHLLLLSADKDNGDERAGFVNPTFNFDSAAGIDYEVDVTKPEGQKVTILRMSNGQPWDPKKHYRVALNSYRANGGGELLTKGAGIDKDSLESRILWRSDRDLRYYLMKEIENEEYIDPVINDNWRFIPRAWTIPAGERDRELIFGKEK